MSHTISLLKPSDSKAYRAIRLEALKAFPEFFCASYAQQAKLEKLYFERLIEENSDKGKIVGAFLNGELVAICGVTFETKLIPGAGEIIQMYVRPEMQGRGLAKKMVMAIFNHCSTLSIDHLVLEVFKTNVGAIALYETCGFAVNATLGNDLDTLVMTVPVNRQ